LGICYDIDCACLPAERDAFDTLFDHAPDKLNIVKRVCTLFLSLTLYANLFQEDFFKLHC